MIVPFFQLLFILNYITRLVASYNVTDQHLFEAISASAANCSEVLGFNVTTWLSSSGTVYIQPEINGTLTPDQLTLLTDCKLSIDGVVVAYQHNKQQGQEMEENFNGIMTMIGFAAFEAAGIQVTLNRFRRVLALAKRAVALGVNGYGVTNCDGGDQIFSVVSGSDDCQTPSWNQKSKAVDLHNYDPSNSQWVDLFPHHSCSSDGARYLIGPGEANCQVRNTYSWVQE
ncbi:uncharacterized protein LALA0_S02e11166g [Lachancea lanzarotensis]|uniref:LALA0S02e11166g1_1 n=1 Tax=Lachancea lanzarotensis TaxID=1245769 RepID=A0A0C7N3V9_9SACH|nr:uncharacterized protein LALA0_S02e11166g [Lachancea lanzarotensis]CEP61294.1 LALA0S02e11166g1_1 [Lachancea lanzarotensis]